MNWKRAQTEKTRIEQLTLFQLTFGNNVRKRRKKLGMNQTDLARLIGLSRCSVTNIETGRQKILLETLMDLAHALETTPAALLK